jgi:hypothetical protein
MECVYCAVRTGYFFLTPTTSAYQIMPREQPNNYLTFTISTCQKENCNDRKRLTSNCDVMNIHLAFMIQVNICMWYDDLHY